MGEREDYGMDTPERQRPLHPDDERRQDERARDVERGRDASYRDTRAQDEISDEPLLTDSDRNLFRERWASVQAAFIDEPRGSVEEANRLVAEISERVMDGFHSQRNQLESRWTSGDQVSTEDLRQTLRRYRAFFDRLLWL